MNDKIHPVWLQNVHKALQYIPLPFTSSFPLMWRQTQSSLCMLVLSDLSDPLGWRWRRFKLLISIRTIWKPVVNNVQQPQNTLWYPPRILSPVTLQNKLDGLQAICCMDLTWLWLAIVQQAAANEAAELKVFTMLKSLSYMFRDLFRTIKEQHSGFCNGLFCIPNKISSLMWASKDFFAA